MKYIKYINWKITELKLAVVIKIQSWMSTMMKSKILLACVEQSVEHDKRHL